MGKDIRADGLRGVSALTVIICHFFISFSPLGFIYLYGGAASQGAQPSPFDSFLQLPIVSVLWNGNLAVMVFFVLSGYVLTKSFYDNGDVEALKIRAARRVFRFYIPVAMGVLMSYAVLHFNMGRWKEAGELSGSWWLSHFWGFDATLKSAMSEALHGALFSGKSLYTPPLWTMRIELIGSFIVFSYVALKLRGPYTIVSFLTVLICMYNFMEKEWIYYICFIVGSHLNEVDIISRKITKYFLFVVAIYLGAYDTTYLYNWVDYVNVTSATNKDLCNALSGALIVLSVKSGVMNYLFESRISQFLGKISYSSYLVHFPVILSLSSWLYVKFHSYGNDIIFIPLNLIITLIVVWLISVVFNRLFDEGSVKFSKKIIPSK